MRRGRRSLESVELDMTPMIDVVFLLLIFFMVSTTFTDSTQLEISLPEAQGETKLQEQKVLEVSINVEGDYAINGRQLIRNDIDTLMSAIRKVSNSNNQQPIVINADAKSPHQAVVTALDAAGRLGFRSVNISTKRPEA
jgi:biopolymer transport protein ExbD